MAVTLPDVDLRIGVEKNGTFSCNETIDSFFHGKNVISESILHWLKLVSNGRMKFTTYWQPDDYGWNLELFEDLQNGIIDVSLREFVADEDELSKYEVIPTLSSSSFQFYTKMPNRVENELDFLFDPFETNVWIVVATCAIVICFMSYLLQLQKYFRQTTVTKIFVFFSLVEALISCAYSTHLRALLTTPNDDIPIKSIRHLIEKVKKGETKIYLEGKYSWRWYLLVGDKEIPEEFSPLQQAIYETNSLIIDYNVTSICEIVYKNTNAIYLAHEDIMQEQCTEFCFWTYPLQVLPNVPSVLLMSKKSKFIKRGQIFSHAILNYRLNAIRMQKRRTIKCDFKKFQSIEYIGSKLFMVLAILFVASLFCCCIVLRFETYLFMKEKKS